MSSYVKLHTAETSMLLIFMGSFAFLMGATALLPKSVGATVGGIGYFAIILVGFLFIELYSREMANPYPYIQLIIRPSNEIVHLLTLPDKTEIWESGGQQAAYLPLKYGCDFPFTTETGEQTYLKADKVLIHYHGEWTSHAHGRPGIGVFRNYNVKHPNTEILEVVQLEHSPFSIEFSESVPVFQLVMGSRDVVPDVDMQNIDMTVFGKDGKDKDGKAIDLTNVSASLKAVLLKNVSLTSDLQEATRRANYWQQTCYKLANETVQQRNAITGLRQSVTAAKGLAYEHLLSVWVACHNFDKALKQLKGQTWDSYVKYIFAFCCLALVVVYLYLEPQVVTEIMGTLNNPLVVGAVVFVAFVVFIIYLRGRKK